ncbi:MAG: NAD(P)/FAD-dependent oxidoreductase [Cytophagia bacterium]|nr:NAD(P)/FAD-dependent oxidoreductase [Cytophagia bacterium]NBW35202.1 NAD(P)/FAD-dependent oxidoreductase [Cytophagia bacterium]
MFDLVIIGGGAAGFYGAIQAAEKNKKLTIAILEKTTKLLSKVTVSGGGRCNVTHHCFEAKKLSKHYPRGEKALKDLFKIYQAKDVVTWFESKGVKLKVEEDGRMFPTTDDSQTIVNLFLREADRHNITIHTSTAVKNVVKDKDHFTLETENNQLFRAKKILIAMGGHPSEEAYNWIKNLKHSINKPIPSLFTFNAADKRFTELMGVAVKKAYVKIEGTKLFQEGPLLITHWGLSGPAVIKLSAWAAEYLHAEQYKFNVLVSWIGEKKEDDLRADLLSYKTKYPKQRVAGNPLFELPQRLWTKLCDLAEIEEGKIWAELSLKAMNKLLENIMRCRFEIKGKTTFKEEFVTCGGVPMEEIDLNTMESKIVSNLFFAGEVLNIDGETGGFNFQGAWTTAYVAAQTIAGIRS